MSFFNAEKPTPAAVSNRPGLSALSRRIGVHSQFREAMIRGLSSANRPGLSELRSREEGDFTLALLDAWAGVCDTLAFYVERSANESCLRTATERGSLRNLARLIGYELAPAKAASVFFAFEAEPGDAPEAVLEYPAPIGVRSIPRDGEAPQYFETVETLTARADWNAMRPRLTREQILHGSSTEIVLTPESARVKIGDPVLFLRGGDPVPIAPEGETASLVRRVSFTREGEGRRVHAALVSDPPQPAAYFVQAYPLFAYWSSGEAVTSTSLAANVAGQSWSLAGLSATTALTGVSLTALTAAIIALPAFTPDPVLPHAMRVKAACFGHNAVVKLTTPVVDGTGVTGTAYTLPVQPGTVAQTAGHAGEAAPANAVHLFLDREYDEIVEDSVVVLRQGGAEAWVKVDGVESVSVEAYGLSAKVTRLTLPEQGLSGSGGTVDLSSFRTRGATVLAAPEALSLADLVIDAAVGAASGDIGADEVELDAPYLSLLPGKKVALTGERADLAGVFETEVKEIADNRLVDGRSVLTFAAELARRYVRDTVVMNANVAEATHGETMAEVLGDGDASASFQAFALKNAPLTFVAARSESGMAAALEIRVDGVRWDEAPDFRGLGREDRVYVLRMGEDGAARVIFGDGITGARLPTGQGNVEAVYRKGAGEEGMLEARQLSLIAARPAGLKGVVNPQAPAGGAPAEALEDARVNAPLKVLTLGRVVSLRDYEDFARGFASIAKARADWSFDGFSRPIQITVAGTGGALLPETGEDMKNLLAALRAAGEADVKVSLRNHRPAHFRIAARLYIDAAYLPDDVFAAGEAALRARFGFDARALGQGVSRAEVMAALQGVAGVLGVDLDLLHRSDQPESREKRLIAAAARPGLRGAPEPAELLTLAPEPAVLEVA